MPSVGVGLDGGGPTTAYTDGSCDPATGFGAWAVILLDGDVEVGRLSGTEPETTNQREELRAAVAALEAAPAGDELEIVSDSAYLVETMRGGFYRLWPGNDWRSRANGREIRNRDLWEELARLVELRRVSFRHVRAHGGDRCDPLNAEVDRLARRTRRTRQAAAR